MSPGQGLYLCAVAMATLVMTNTRAPLCQVGEAQRSSLWVSITAGCRVVIFWQCQRAWGLLSGEVWDSQWGERDAGPIRTPNTQPHSRRRYISPPKHSRALWWLISCIVPSYPSEACFTLVTKVKQVLEQIHGSRIQPAPRLNTHSWAACYAQHFAG